MASFTHCAKFPCTQEPSEHGGRIIERATDKKVSFHAHSFGYTRSLSEGQACRRGKSGNKQFSKESLGRDKFSLIRGPQQIA